MLIKYLLLPITLIAASCAPPKSSELAPIGNTRFSAKFDFVEYTTVASHRLPTRVLLFDSGGGRIDLYDSETRANRTYLIPVSPREVRRLIDALGTIDVESLTEASYHKDAANNLSLNLIIRCSRAGHERTFKMSTKHRVWSHVVDGIATEIETVGFLDFAESIDLYRQAELPKLATDEERRMRFYSQAITTFAEGQRAYCQRYGVVYEPYLCRFNKGDAFPVFDPIVFNQVVDKLKQPDVNRNAVIIQSLRESWDALTEPTFTFFPVGHATILFFKQDRNNRLFEYGRSGTLSTIPKDTSEELQEAKWNPLWTEAE